MDPPVLEGERNKTTMRVPWWQANYGLFAMGLVLLVAMLIALGIAGAGKK